MKALPLEGIRVVAITNAWAGPYATQLLGDWGAEVIRIESIFRSTRYVARADEATLSRNRSQRIFSWPDMEPGERPFNRLARTNAHMRNKLAMTKDMTKPEGIEIFNKLIAKSDVFIENNVPVTMDKFGISWETLSQINPSLIMLRMPGYGLTGPYRDFRGLGSHMEAIAGHTLIRSYPDTEPGQQPDVFPADAAGGAAAVFATIMALMHRKKTGEGQLIEFATAENFMPLIGDFILDYTMNDRLWAQMGNTDRYMAPHNIYPCDGADRWIAIACRNDEDWALLCNAMNRQELIHDNRFNNDTNRYNNRDDLDTIITEWTKTKVDKKLMHELQELGVPAGMLFDDQNSLEDPHLTSREFFQELTHAESGTHLYPGIQFKMRNTPNEIHRAPAMFGEHNKYVYKEILGYDDNEYARLEREGHIGTDFDPSVP